MKINVQKHTNGCLQRKSIKEKQWLNLPIVWNILCYWQILHPAEYTLWPKQNARKANAQSNKIINVNNNVVDVWYRFQQKCSITGRLYTKRVASWHESEWLWHGVTVTTQFNAILQNITVKWYVISDKIVNKLTFLVHYYTEFYNVYITISSEIL